jgi:YidC/Oxa1 family membrane protein insertase
MSTTMDKAQRVILMIVPLVFISVVAHFPMGLVLYWVTTNLWTVGQGLITRRLVPKTPMPPMFGGRRTSRTPPPAPSKTDGKTPAPARAAAPKPKPPAPRRVKKKKGGPRR